VTAPFRAGRQRASLAAYDPSLSNDRLLLGLKGTMSEFELTVLRRRLLDAAVAKARRGGCGCRSPWATCGHARPALYLIPIDACRMQSA